MTLPNFFIIGAPRCATTTVYEELRRHPDIFMSPVKEPLFFAVEGRREPFHGIQDNQGIRQLAEYRRLFAGASGQRLIGEASPMYLYSNEAAHRLNRYAPHAKLIAILRNPVDRAYSHFLFHRGLGIEPLSDFRAALEAEDERERAGWSPYWYYRKMGLYSDSLDRYRRLFAPGQIKVFLFEEIEENPAAVVRRIIRFLGAEDACRLSSPIRHNLAAVPRSERIEAALAKLGRLPTESRLLLGLQKAFLADATRLRLRRRVLDPLLIRLQRWNRWRPAMSSSIRRELVDYYRFDILRTQEVLERDLSPWLSL